MREDKQNGFSFQLQRFADGGTDGGTEGQESGGKAPADASAGQEGDKPADESPKADEAAVQRRIDEALASAKVKWEKDYKRKAEAAKKEAERLSKLSDDERAKAELESSRKELEAKEQELKKKELKLEMVKVLSDRKIPVEFMDYLIAEDSESTMSRITTFEKAYKKAIENGVNEKLKGKAPKAGTQKAGAASASVKNGFFDAIYKNQVKR